MEPETKKEAPAGPPAESRPVFSAGQRHIAPRPHALAPESGPTLTPGEGAGGVGGRRGDEGKHGWGPCRGGPSLTPYADCYRCPIGLEYPGCGVACAEFARKTNKTATSGAVAGVLIEPMQGTAGNVVPPPEFLPAIRDIAHEAGALLIAGEMITGFGRTGE